MSYIDNQDPNLLLGGGQAPGTRGGGSSFGSGSTPGASASKPNESGAFTNLSAYMGANQGQGGAMVNAATEGTRKDYDSVMNDVGGALKSFNPGSPAPRYHFGVGEQGYNAYNQYVSGLNPTQAAPDILGATSGRAANIQQANKSLSGGTGSVIDFISANNKARTGGGNLLNGLIAAKDPTAANTVKDLTGQWSNLTSYLTGANDTLGSRATGYNQAVSGAKTDTARTNSQLGTIGGQISSTQAALNSGDLSKMLQLAPALNPYTGKRWDDAAGQKNLMQDITRYHNDQLTSLQAQQRGLWNGGMPMDLGGGHAFLGNS